jgi:hypothetical protein
MSLYKQHYNRRTGQFNLVPSYTVVHFKDGVATYVDLPIAGNAIGDGRITNDTGHLYIWSIDVPVGALTDWADQGDIMNIDWSVITNKPTSAVADIDDAVSKKHTQNTDTYLATVVTNILYVDNKRVDTYTENGSITKPFKTIQAAITYAITQTPSPTNLFTIVISSGIYNEAITMASYVNLKGIGTRSSVVIFQNAVDVITLANNVEVQNLTVRTGTTGDIATFIDNGVACTVKIIDVNLESTYAGGGGWTGFYLTANSYIIIDRIYVRNTATAGGTGDQGIILINGADAVARITNSDIYMAGAPGVTSSKSILGIIAPSAAIIISNGNRYEGDAFCNMIYAESGTIISNNDTILTLYENQIDPSATINIDEPIVSKADGDYKKVTAIEYNPTTGLLRISYKV